MNEQTRNLTVGLTALAAVVGLCVLLFLFGYVPTFFRPTYHLTVEMPDALRLSTGSRVKLFGIDIGEVRLIKLQQPAGTGVTALLEITDTVLIPIDSHAEVDTDLLGGSATLNIVPPPHNGTVVATLATDGSAVIPGQLGSLAGAFSQLDRLATSIENVSTEWRTVGSNLNTLLAAADAQAVDAGTTDATLRTVVQRIDQRLSDVRSVITGIQRYTNNDDIYNNITATTDNAKQFSDKLGNIDQRVSTFLGETQNATTQTAAKAQEMLDRYTHLANELTASTASLQKAIDKINAGEGTIAKLLTDPTLYDSFEATADRVSRMTDELTLMLQKWKAEGVPIQF